MNSIFAKINKLFKIFFSTLRWITYIRLYNKYKGFTMVAMKGYCLNLSLIEKFKYVEGCVVECGVWRGGMSAGIAELLGNERNYYLYDSFEGLPDAEEIDGEAALNWQSKKDDPRYLDNCAAEQKISEECMKMSGVKKVTFVKGWFSDTLPKASFEQSIAILRLDADWYSSTMDCFKYLFDKVAKGGLIILDDYHVWDGCSRATHDFISEKKLDVRIHQYKDSNICYIIKK
jgi:O-methyltransferase